MRRRLLAVMLAGTMVFGQIPAVYAAENEVGVEALADAGPEAEVPSDGMILEGQASLSEEAVDNAAGYDGAYGEIVESASDDYELVEVEAAADFENPDYDGGAAESSVEEAEEETVAEEQDDLAEAVLDADEDFSTDETLYETVEEPAGETLAQISDYDAVKEVDFDFDRHVRPGWDDNIEKYHDVWVYKSTEPNEGEWIEGGAEITEIISSDPEVVSVEPWEDRNGWNLRPVKVGQSVIVIHYTDPIRNGIQTAEYEWIVEDELYEIELWTSHPNDHFLPGDEAVITARLMLYTNEYEADRTDKAEWRWQAAGESELAAEINEKLASAQGNSVSFTIGDLPEDDYDDDVDIVAEALDPEDGAHVLAKVRQTIHIRRRYEVVYPYTINEEDESDILVVGKTYTVTPKIHIFRSEGEPFEEIAPDEVEWRHYDDSVLEITDNGNGSWSLKKLKNEHTGVNLVLSYSDPDDEDNIELEWWYHLQSYDAEVRFDLSEGNEVYDEQIRDFDVVYPELNSDSTLNVMVLANYDDGRFDEPYSGKGVTLTKEKLTIDGSVLRAQGIHGIQVFPQVLVNGIQVNDENWGEWFEIREPRYELPIDNDDYRSMLPNWEEPIDREGYCYIEDANVADMLKYSLSLKSVETVHSWAEYDPRPVVSVEETEDGWQLRAIRGGGVKLIFDIAVYKDGKVYKTFTRTRNIEVGDRTVELELYSSPASGRVRPGETITIKPAIFGEQYDMETGDYSALDTSKMGVRLEIEREWADWGDDSEHSDEEADEYWYAGEKKNGVNRYELRYPSAQDIQITILDGAPEMGLRIRAWAVEEADPGNPEDNGDRAFAETYFEVRHQFWSVDVPDWDEELPIGASALLEPVILNEEGEEVSPDGLRIEFDDNALEIQTENGAEVRVGDLVEASDLPLTVLRKEGWRTSIHLAVFNNNEDGEEEEVAYTDLPLLQNQYDVRFERGDGKSGGYTWGTEFFIDGEGVSVKRTADSEKTMSALKALKAKGYPVETESYIGFKKEDTPEKLNFSFTDSEWNESTGILKLTRERAKELREYLLEEYDGALTFVVVFQAYCGDREYKLVDCVYNVTLLENEITLEDDFGTTETGGGFYYDKGTALLRVRNAEYPEGKEYEVKITGIEFDNTDCFEVTKDEDGTWHIKALKAGETNVHYTFTGGPEGIAEHDTTLFAADTAYFNFGPQEILLPTGEWRAYTPDIRSVTRDGSGKRIEAPVDPSCIEVNLWTGDEHIVQIDYEKLQLMGNVPGRTALYVDWRVYANAYHAGEPLQSGSYVQDIVVHAHEPVSGKPAKAATCTAAGNTEETKCSVCGEILKASTSIPALGHSFGAWTVTKAATAEAEGVETRTCSRCGQKETRAIAKLVKKAQPMSVKAKAVTLKAKKKKQAIKAANAFTVTNAQGAVTYAKKGGSGALTISKNGKITVKKGTKKGTYKIKVEVTAAGNAEYNSGSKTVTVKVKIKK